MPEAPFHSLRSAADLDEALQQSEQEPVVLYKHSTTCPISAGANDELQQLTREDDPAVFRVTVQKARELSDEIAEQFSIRHESPQAIVLEDRRPVFDTSHGDITAARIRKAAGVSSQ